MNRHLILIITCLIAFTISSNGQSKRKELYDSLLVGDRITPAVSSVMMPETYTEIILSGSLLTTNALFTDDGDVYNLSSRSTYLLSTLQVTYGLTSSGRINAGLDLSYRVGRVDGDPDSSPLKVLGSTSEGLTEYARRFTSIGLRVRYMPTRNPNFVIQNSLVIPFDPTSDESVFLGDNRYAFNTQFLYNQLLGRKFFLFGQADVQVRLKDDTYDTDYTVPVNIYTTYLVNDHLFPFVRLGLGQSWGEVNRAFYGYGIGLQFQFTTMFNLNFMYTDTFAGKNSNQWAGYNLGIRVVL